MKWNPFATIGTSALVTGYMRRVTSLCPDVVQLVLAFYESLELALRRCTPSQPMCSPLFLIGGFKWLFKFHLDPETQVCYLNVWLASKPKIMRIVAVDCKASMRCATAKKQKVTKDTHQLHDSKPFVTLVFRSEAISASSPPRFNVKLENFKISIRQRNRRCYRENWGAFLKEQGTLEKALDLGTRCRELEMTWHTNPLRGSISGQTDPAESPLFFMFGMVWSLLLLAKGVKLVCVKPSSNIDRICLLCQLIVIGETDVAEIHARNLDIEDRRWWRGGDPIQSRTISAESLCRTLRDKGEAILRVKLTLVDVFDKITRQVTTDYLGTFYPCEQVPMREFAWDIDSLDQKPLRSQLRSANDHRLEWVLSIQLDKDCDQVSLVLHPDKEAMERRVVAVTWMVSLNGGGASRGVIRFWSGRRTVATKMLTLNRKELRNYDSRSFYANVLVLRDQEVSAEGAVSGW